MNTLLSVIGQAPTAQVAIGAVALNAAGAIGGIVSGTVAAGRVVYWTGRTIYQISAEVIEYFRKDVGEYESFTDGEFEVIAEIVQVSDGVLINPDPNKLYRFVPCKK